MRKGADGGRRLTPTQGGVEPGGALPVFEPPLRGRWAILNPPGHPVRAFDFLAVTGRRNPYRDVSLMRHLFGRIDVESTLCWDAPVHAVADGEVIAAQGDLPDRHELSMLRDLYRLIRRGPPPRPPFGNLGGNHVILRCGDLYPLYAHLRQGSLVVKAGERVRAGQVLGRIGNSGASLQPHLHFQVMVSPDPFPLFGNLVPFVLSRAELIDPDGATLVEAHAPRNGEVLRFGGSDAIE